MPKHQMEAHEQFKVDGLVDWDLSIDHSDASSLTATLVVKTKTLRHEIVVTGLEDGRTLDEIFHTVPEIRVIYTGDEPFQYTLRLISRYWDVEFPVKTFKVDTRSLFK